MLTAQIIAAVLLVLGSTLVLHTVIQADRPWMETRRPRKAVPMPANPPKAEMPERRAA